MTQVFYPQLWARIDLRVENFIRNKKINLPSLPKTGDPITNTNTFALGYDIVPNRATVTLRSYREGNEAKLTIPAAKLPIDPRVVRQAAITIFAGNIKSSEWAQAITGTVAQKEALFLPEVDDETGESNEIFRGFIDDLSISYDENEQSISISARDLTGIFLDNSLPVAALARVPKGLPIDKVIQLLIDGEELALLGGKQYEFFNSEHSPKDIKVASRRLAHELASTATRLAKAITRLGLDPTNEEIANEVIRLTAKQSALSTGQIAMNNLEISAVAAASGGAPAIARLGLHEARGMKVVNATGEPLPSFGDLKGASWFDSAGSIKKSRSRGKGSNNTKISYWDFITDLCVGNGYIVYIRVPPTTNTITPDLAQLFGVDPTPPAEIVIDRPRTYYKDIPSEVRRFIYGYNVNRLELTRNYNGRELPTAIVVSAIEDETGRIVTQRHPPEKPSLTKKQKGSVANRATLDVTGTGDKEELDRFIMADRIPAANIKEALTRYAEMVYEQLSRGEMEVKIETKTMNGFPSNWDTENVDMLRLRPADAIEVEVTPLDSIGFVGVTTAGQYQEMSADQRLEYLTKIGMEPTLIAALLLAEDNPLIQSVFRVQDVMIEFTENEGFHFQVDALNYLDVSAEGANP